ncbi:MAG: DUF3303 family protein [Nitrolancea sp.]
MSLFVVQHQHSAETCPARDPQMGPMLLTHLSAKNAAAHDVKIHGEAVINGAHRLYLIVDAPGEEQISQLMRPFSQVGTVEIFPASPCEAVVGRGC